MTSPRSGVDLSVRGAKYASPSHLPSRNPHLKPGCTFYEKMRKVSFSRQVLVVEVDSDNQDRKGVWEQIGRDRERFKRRIAEVEQKIGWIWMGRS